MVIESDALRSALVDGLSGLDPACAFGSIAVTDGSEVAAVATGRRPDGRPFRPTDPMPVYCAGRLPLQCRIVELCCGGALSWSSRVGRLVPEFRDAPVGGLRVEDVFAHRGDLWKVDGVAARLLGRAQLSEQISHVRPSTASRYSDYAAGHLMGRIAEEIEGVDYRRNVWSRAVFAPVARHDEIVPFVDVRTGRAMTALGDVTRANVERWNPAFGWFGSAPALAVSAYRSVALVLQGGADVGILGDIIGASDWDPGLERRLDLGVLGNVAYLGSDFVGLSGQGGLAFAGTSADARFGVSYVVSPALPTPAALARSVRLLDLIAAAIRR